MNAERQEAGNRLRIGSVFSGIGGIEYGLEAAGVGQTLYQIEIDDYCRDVVLDRHWPDTTKHSDITEVDIEALPAIDVLVGGFPCQDISVAAVGSARDGLQGARSGLWAYMERIAEVARPEWIVVENVAHGAAKWVPGVQAALGRLGYSTLPVTLAANACGRAHIRRRVFVLAHAHSFEVRQQQQRVSWGRTRDLREEGQAVAVELGEECWWESCADFLRVDDGIPEELDGARFKALGNSVVPQCAEVVGWMIREITEAA